MAAVAVVMESRTARAALRRSLPRGAGTLVSCRTEGALRRTLRSRLVEAMVVEPRVLPFSRLRALAEEFPAIPVFVASPFRPDDGDLLAACARVGLPVLVEGVDDAASGELVARGSTQAARRRALAEAPRLLRLRTELQREVWDLLIGSPDRPLRTGDLARKKGVTREHLSRQFAVEAAPNLKRVIDLTRVVAAAQLLRDPGHTAADVAAILRFASASHLNRTSRRIAGAGTRRLGDLGPRGVLEAFARGKTRSRL